MLLRRLNTLFVGREFHELPRINSTNEYALDILSKSKPAEGTVISTPDQYAGRGQIGSRWESEPGKNISLSIILYPAFLPAQRQFLLNQAVALAVFDLVNKFLQKKVTIKWPNDIYVQDRKIAGILIQNTLSNSHIRNSVIGIGINVNQEAFSAPLINPTSFRLEAQKEFDAEELIAGLCSSAETRYLQLKAGNMVSLHREYLENLYHYNEQARYRRNNGETFTGTITGIADTGQLRMRTHKGEETFDLKEITFL